ncbi:MAG: FecR family protein [Elusimicrobia bacterium]|nr:FecR family protein [Candidatus Obscuribacterium magneticum]
MKKVLLPLLFCVVTTFAMAEEPSIEEFRITGLEGKAAVIPQGSRKASPAVKNMRLQNGDQVVTGEKGRLEIGTKAGTVIELKEKSSLKVDSLSDQMHVFFLRAGRFLARFKSYKDRKGPSYKVRTPVAVASVRGTDLALDINDKDELEAGVIEGDVHFDPADESSTSAKELWPEGEVVVTSSEGFKVSPGSAPIRMPEIPPAIVPSLVWFESVRDRVKTLQEEWKDLDPPSQQALRKTAFRDTIDWQVPDKFLPPAVTPKEQLQNKALEVPKRIPPKIKVEPVK